MGGLLNVSQTFSFIADNVVKIAESITNVSGVAQMVNFARNVDYDVAPTAFNEFTKSNFWNNPITAATYWGFENPSPLAPYIFNAAPGSINIGDLGAGLPDQPGNTGCWCHHVVQCLLRPQRDRPDSREP